MAWNSNLDEASVAYQIASAAGPHVQVLAGPGTGKSFAMKRRVARLLEENVPPERILAVTFTRVAAEDLVDEYQDLNKAEQTAISYLSAQSNICVVGDDDQSIYGFKYAQPEGIREWPDLHPGCTRLAMSECHRCPTLIVEMANSLISHNSNRDNRDLPLIFSSG